MSGHEHERLSAFLDDELAPGERAEIAAHLGACAECAARLAELQAVDEAVASLPLEAPGGYFESLPARVRARLEPRPMRSQLQAWSWALAAALLLAVVTPLTLLRRPQAEPRGTLEAPAAPAVVAQPPASSQPPLPQAARDELKPERQPARPVPPRTAPLPEQKRDGFASAPRDAAANAAPVPPAPEPAPAPVAREQELAAAADERAQAADVAGEAGQAVPFAERSAVRSREMAPQAAGAARGEAQGRPARPGANAAAAKLVAVELEWERLDASRPRSAGEWRRLRDEWRLFVARDPAGPRADEARVRTIEAGLEAWRTGSDAADEAAFRGDAAAYLAREDAAQRERVRRLLAEAGRP
jgi:hypothetical protein